MLAIGLVYLTLLRFTPESMRPRCLVGYIAIASVYLYSRWGYLDTAVLGTSVAINFGAGRWLSSPGGAARLPVLVSAILLNLAALAYFKYSNFLLESLAVFGGSSPTLDIILPLGISFFTFQQIAFLVDCYHGRADADSALDYVAFVTFFPQLIAGPIVNHRMLIPQLRSAFWEKVNWLGMGRAAVFFSSGLFKKAVLADPLAQVVSVGYGSPEMLSMPETWLVVLCYTCQLYFDFSGYCDMAIGLGLFFGLQLPVNFDSPYKAPNIQAFWNRWNITLGAFFRDHVFRPMGGMSRHVRKQWMATMASMVLIGLWHGAGWLFVSFGALHGTALLVHRIWRRKKKPMPKTLGVILTFGFVTFSMILFRAESSAHAMTMAHQAINGALTWPGSSFGLVEWTGIFTPKDWLPGLEGPKEMLVLLLLIGLGIIFAGKNNNDVIKAERLGTWLLIRSILAFVIGIMAITTPREFIYFVF